MKVSSPIVCLWPGGRPRDFTGHGRVRWADGDLVPVDEDGALCEGPEARPRRRIGRARRRPTEEEVVQGFEALRERGICPHPYDDDREVARMMVRAWAEAPPFGPGGWGPVENPHGTMGPSVPEELVEPDPRLGINNPMCLIEDEEATDAEEGNSTASYNTYAAVIADVARAGCGRMRHVNQPDLAWYKICARFAGEAANPLEPLHDLIPRIEHDLIPPPDDLYARLIAGDFGAFSRFTLFWQTCVLQGVQVIPILFSYGGGASLDQTEATYHLDEDLTITRDQVRIGRPRHQKTVTVPAEWGWDPFYWDIPELDPTQAESDFQRFALNVYVPTDSTPYMQEAARRKALAIAAFGKAVGEYLVRVDSELANDYSASLGDVIPYVEFGNEFDGAWAPQADTSQDLKDDAAREMGRYCALLAGPIHEACPGVRFKMPDLIYTETDGTVWDARIDWLVRSVTLGVREEVGRWNGDLDARPLERDAWQATSEAANFSWPPSPSSPFGPQRFSATDLVHCVALHLFLSHTDTYDGGAYVALSEEMDYADELELGAIVTSLRRGVARMEKDGFHLEWAVGAVDFPAMVPKGRAVGDIVYLGRDDPNVTRVGANPMYQAGILARRILYLWSFGPEYVSWYTYMSQLKDMRYSRPAWNTEFIAMGLRNDTYTTDTSDGRPYAQYIALDENDEVTFLASQHAWRRPAWFTLRRVAWLLARTEEVTEVWSSEESRIVILRLTAFADQPYQQPNVQASPTYPHAYVIWMDEMSDLQSVSISAQVAADAAFEASSLVPDVFGVPVDILLDGLPAMDANGFPDVETTSWQGWTTYCTDPSTFSCADGRLAIIVRRAHPEANPAPLFLLSDQLVSMIAME